MNFEINTSSVAHKQKRDTKRQCVGNCILQKVLCYIFFSLIHSNCANDPGWLSVRGQRPKNWQPIWNTVQSVFQHFLFVNPKNFPVKVWVPKNTITNSLTAQFYCREVQATQCTEITHRKLSTAFFYKTLAYFLVILENYQGNYYK